MRTSSGFFKPFLFIFICLICAMLWTLQSITPFYQYLENDDKITQKKLSMDQLPLPAVAICSKLPYTQAGLNTFGSAINQDFVLQYMREWLDPSTNQSPDYVTLSSADQKRAENTVIQLLPAAGLKQRLSQLLPKCQDFISSCTYQGQTMSGFECCSNVEPLATLNGMCWIFNNESVQENSIDYPQGIQITFQIPKNSFISNYQSSHPGLEVYLLSPEIRDRVRWATELERAFHLQDKKSVSVLLQQEIISDLKRPKDCGNSPGDALASDKAVPNSTYVPCLIDAIVSQCSCVPLVVVLWVLQGAIESTFLRRFNVSSICTVNEYSRCAQKYMEYARPKLWYYSTPSSYEPLKSSVEKCRRTAQMPCQRTVYHAKDAHERDLPQEYRNTQDFVSRFSLDYDTLVVTDTTISADMDLLGLLTVFGCNLATLFAVGHIIWTLSSCLCDRCCSSHNNKIEPREPIVISSPIRTSRQLPPLEIRRGSTIDPNKTLRNGSQSSAHQQDETSGNKDT
ncbi:amiloride-sensitive sodium channel domain-containing protein [Ditylenchus destructor]|uniref:Amiloride-sensitive sodium channel domain-containing protein n=1 Tax=Ditylenchus destructor TaxID=166010 RepID=A0AAD4R3Q6_9BILA|nr:amiloride-sensitive sodium channel domain-containing protein [Ditylenchus destructor]